MPERIAGELLARLSRFGRIHLLDTCTSTNDYAFSLAREREPAIVVSREQTRGRGRFHRAWFSDSDSLTFSVLFFPEPGETAARAGLTQLAGLALCRAIEESTGLKPLVRWPNDVLVGEQKVAGILCEQKKTAVVIGIGLNVNQPCLPEELAEAASLRIASGRTFDRFELLARILDRLFALLADAAAGRGAALLEETKKRSAILHRRVEIQTLLRKHVGTVIDLDAEGRVVLRTSSGRLAVFRTGQVRRLR